MLRLMLVDDEVYIVDGLCSHLQRQLSDAVEIIKAYSGEEALRHVKRLRIDIVVCDINMPGVDGFALREHFLIHWPACKFIFLTGYASFDYAYRAIQYENTKFLLKNEGYAVIEQAVAAALEEINRERMAARDLAAEPSEEGGRLSRLLRGEQEAGDGAALLVMAKAAGEPAPEVEALAQRVRAHAQGFFRFFISAPSCVYQGAYITWAIRPLPSQSVKDRAPWKRIARFTRGMVEALQSLCLEVEGIPLSFLMTESPVKEADFAACAPVLARLLDMPAFAAGGQPMYSLACDAFAAILDAETRNALWAFGGAMASRNGEGMAQTMEVLAARWTEQAAGCMRQLAEAFASLNGAAPPRGPDIPPRDPAFGRAYKRSVERMLEALAPLPERERQRSVIDRIHRYIGENLSGQMTLTDIAEHVHMNPSYLSRFYKKSCGENLFDYIAAARVEKAKALLAGKQLSVSGVAERVGFSSMGYFSSVFKKRVGMSPQEYKRLYP